jgi:hypothetical protein
VAALIQIVGFKGYIGYGNGEEDSKDNLIIRNLGDS